MRIALISTPFLRVPPLEYGGTELMVAELADSLVKRGHDVTLFGTADSCTSAELRALYNEAQWPPSALSDINHVSWAFQQILEESYDVIHANSALALPYTRYANRLPLVYTLHHAKDQELSDFYSHFPLVWYAAISHDQAEHEIKLPRLEVVYHGLDPEKYCWQKKPDNYVCFLARFSKVKGPHTAIDVAKEAGVPIRVAGEVHAVDEQFAAREVKPRLKLDHVTMLGSVGMDAKVPLLCNARALLAPIEWDEPFGLAFIEAMLSGCPVVAFPRGSVSELVEPGVTGFIVHNAHEMSEIIRPGGPLDNFDRARCRTRAIERFSRDRMAEEYERLYERAIDDTLPITPLASVA